MVDFDKSKAEMLRRELNKVQCWITGYHAGAGHKPNMLGVSIPGEDSVRQAQIFLGDLLRSLDKPVASAKPEEKVAGEEGWVAHDGSGMPVSGDIRVIIKCRDGYIDTSEAAAYGGPKGYNWWIDDPSNPSEDSIVAYKIVS